MCFIIGSMPLSEHEKALCRKRYRKNRTKILARMKAAYDANPEAKKARSKAYRSANPDGCAARDKAKRQRYLAEAQAGTAPFRCCKKCGSKVEWRGRDCRVCRKAVNLAYRAANPEKVKAIQAARYAADPDGERDRVRTWRSANPAKVAAIKHRRYAREAGAQGDHMESEWRAIVELQKYRCADCGQKVKLTKDHIVPLSRGGSNFAFNLQGLCVRCNSRKNCKLPAGLQHTLFDRGAAA
jgi:5-methylcytosine-specific restriction endonuclease McrA